MTWIATMLIIAARTLMPDPPVGPPSTPPALSNAAAIAIEVGVTPEAVAIAGATASQVQEWSASLAEATGLVGAVAEAKANVVVRATHLRAADAALRRLPGDEALVAARDSARSEMANAHAVLTEARAAARHEALQDGISAVEPIIITLATNARWLVPIEYRVAQRTPTEWEAIEIALRAEARAERSNESLGSGHATLLAAVRSDPAVIQAKANLDAHLGALTQALGEPEL